MYLAKELLAINFRYGHSSRRDCCPGYLSHQVISVDRYSEKCVELGCLLCTLVGLSREAQHINDGFLTMKTPCTDGHCRPIVVVVSFHFWMIEVWS